MFLYKEQCKPNETKPNYNAVHPPKRHNKQCLVSQAWLLRISCCSVLHRPVLQRRG